MPRWLRIAVLILLGIVGFGAVALLGADTGIGHRFVAERIGAIRTANGLRFAVGRIDGSLYSDTRLVDLRVYDPKGLVFAAPAVALDWHPFRWFWNDLAIDRLAIPRARLLKVPETIPSSRRGPVLPDFDIHIGAVSLGRLTIAPAVLGTERIGALAGHADIAAGRARVALDARVAGTDRLHLAIDAEPDADRFDIDVDAKGAAGGVLSRMTGPKRLPVSLSIGGDGRWSAWRGSAIGYAGVERIVDLKLAAALGRYTLSGLVAPAPITHGKAKSLTAPLTRVNGSATFANRRIDGELDLRSGGIAAQVTGVIDLAANAYRNVRIRARLIDPHALFPNMIAQALTLRAIVDGPFATASFDYRLDAERFGFDDTGFENAHAAGRGHLSHAPVLLPVRFTAARVTGVGDVAGGILRELSADGVLRVTTATVTGDGIRIRSDKLSGIATLTLDLDSGDFQVNVTGGIGRYLIPGLGLVDVRSSLRVVPGPDGHGTRVLGQGSAQMLRLDNAFFASLTGGLPRVTTGLERTLDGVMHFSNLVLSAPDIRIAGNGYRRKDGTVHFEGSGRQTQYGPLTLVLDGDIGKPTIDLVFTSPNATLGLSDVRAHLDPTPQGFAFTANGGSRMGAFAGSGAILLPDAGQASIAVAGLDVGGSHARGSLAIVPGGFDGRLDVSGGIGGALLFAPVGSVQRIEAHLDARGAAIAGVTARAAHLDAAVLLDPAATRIEATMTGQGLRYGNLSVARIAANLRLNGGIGELRASAAGSQGRAFDIQTVTTIAPDRYSIAGKGTLDGRAITLSAPALVTRIADGWQLAPTRLGFAGGEAAVSGRLADGQTSIDAALSRMPLAILDIGYPGLGLGGTASGKLAFTRGAGAPTGRVDITIRGLSRTGLVLASQPIDMGLAGVLSANRIAARAVMAGGGRTLGRAQGQVTLGTGSDLARRIDTGQLFAQLRYAGPADTLWRLTGVELFDLSGPIAIGADIGGRPDAPVIRGALQANGARIESATTGTVFTNVQASGRFNGSRLAIERFAADAGRGGRVTGTGQFDFAAVHGIGLDLSLQADKAVMINRDDIGATVTGPLRFVSDGAGGRIGGDVTLVKSRYRLGQATAASAVPQLNIREINLPGGIEEAQAPTAPWTLAIRARAPAQLLVSGLGLTSEWSADLDIAGAPDDPAITGRATMIRGDYEFAGRQFSLNRGIIRFAGEVPANPALDIEANADSTGLNATIKVTGYALKPEIQFTSVPALPEDELLSRLLFGTSITNLSAPEALQLAAAVASLQSGNSGLNPINAVRRVAGLDRLRILPPDPQTGQGTAVAAGKYVTRRLYAEIITDGAGYSATQVEFQVTRWLSLLSTVSTLGRQSGNVRVSKDY